MAAIFVVALPGVDARTGFREAFVPLRPVLAQIDGCVASRLLGESERGMLDYYTGLQTERIESHPLASGCDWLFEQQRDVTLTDDGLGCPGRERIWEGRRPGHPEEMFRLCRSPRQPAAGAEGSRGEGQ